MRRSGVPGGYVVRARRMRVLNTLRRRAARARVLQHAHDVCARVRAAESSLRGTYARGTAPARCVLWRVH